MHLALVVSSIFSLAATSKDINVTRPGAGSSLAVSDASSFADIKIDQTGRLVTNILGDEASKSQLHKSRCRLIFAW
jgi:hypothetical protein